jgi:hypothetical protein
VRLLTQQQGGQISPLGGFLQGASKDPKLQTGFEKLFWYKSTI